MKALYGESDLNTKPFFKHKDNIQLFSNDLYESQNQASVDIFLHFFLESVIPS